MFDTLIIGGGPCGLAAAIEAHKQGLNYLVLEKGAVAESIRRYPLNMTFFSTAPNIAIGDIPFPTVRPRATRAEALAYYRSVVDHFQLKMQLRTTVRKVTRTATGFQVHTDRETLESRTVVLATGYFDVPRRLNIPGEELPHVTSYYQEAHPYAFSDVVIVGGGNSAVEAALDLFRNHARVTMIVREPDLKPTVKYWVRPDLDNRLKEGNIRLITDTQLTEIQPGTIHFKSSNPNNPTTLPADFVIKLIGYHSDRNFLQDAGLKLGEDYIPEYDEQTLETNVPGMYLAGTVVAGIRTEKVFIENGRLHAAPLVADIRKKWLSD